MKLAVSGKGGVGKTTLAAALAVSYSRAGNMVFAIDADPSANLPLTLGFPESENLVPLIQMKDLIAERTGSTGKDYGGYFKLNPRVDDIPDRFSRNVDGIKLLVLGTLFKGGGGCACPENVFLKSLLSHLVLIRKEVVLVDMEAGMEHLGRATLAGIDALLVVVEPGMKSLITAKAIASLAKDIGIRNIFAVGNRTRGPEDEAFIRKEIAPLPLLGCIPFSERIIEADQKGVAVHETEEALLEHADRLRATIENKIRQEG